MQDYDELARLWYEFLLFGPPIDEQSHALDFVEWLDTEPENPYGLSDVEYFFAEKERREGTALPRQGPFQPPDPEF
jgi:hypothetical protein